MIMKFRAWIRKADGTYDCLNPMTIQQVLQPGQAIVALSYVTSVSDLEEYTGLEDKNGQEIYEGDIVKSSYKCAQPKISQIVIEDGNSYILGEDLATGNEMLVSDYIGEIKIIGNVHENPELLEKK